MQDGSKWGEYLPKKLYIFLKAYTSTLLFKISPIVSTVFWIISVVVNNFSKSIRYSSAIYLIMVSFALLSLIIPGVYFYLKNKPFHIFLTWTPIEPEAVDRRLKHRELVRIREAKNGSAKPCAMIHAYVDKKVKEYELVIDARGPLKAKPTFAPAESEHENRNKLVCENVETYDFYFPVEIDEKQGHEGGELRREVQITDGKRGGIELLTLDVL
ncbi:hypothetical protein [Haladaptatus cibarius]|uniref:hypothetical protein n=1 Tax=Haladaptatus cibarius TaxID=453847 RepID=UPI000679ABBC|nr:hypothetical protein [Haladaptatus cibarius]